MNPEYKYAFFIRFQMDFRFLKAVNPDLNELSWDDVQKKYYVVSDETDKFIICGKRELNALRKSQSSSIRVYSGEDFTMF